MFIVSHRWLHFEIRTVISCFFLLLSGWTQTHRDEFQSNQILNFFRIFFFLPTQTVLCNNFQFLLQQKHFYVRSIATTNKKRIRFSLLSISIETNLLNANFIANWQVFSFCENGKKNSIINSLWASLYGSVCLCVFECKKFRSNCHQMKFQRELKLIVTIIIIIIVCVIDMGRTIDTIYTKIFFLFTILCRCVFIFNRKYYNLFR